MLPMPAEQKFSEFGFAFARATRSASEPMPASLLATTRSGPRPIIATGANSFRMSREAVGSVAARVTKVEVTNSRV